mmetsp:Transcript_18180/g.30958  ORF Transcript_18180/g.30958 Transcript_18180/m.30958 type:complete len:289 (-) Transcript_18180:869-1735(-)
MFFSAQERETHGVFFFYVDRENDSILVTNVDRHWQGRLAGRNEQIKRVAKSDDAKFSISERGHLEFFIGEELACSLSLSTVDDQADFLVELFKRIFSDSHKVKQEIETGESGLKTWKQKYVKLHEKIDKRAELHYSRNILDNIPFYLLLEEKERVRLKTMRLLEGEISSFGSRDENEDRLESRDEVHEQGDCLELRDKEHEQGDCLEYREERNTQSKRRKTASAGKTKGSHAKQMPPKKTEEQSDELPDGITKVLSRKDYSKYVYQVNVGKKKRYQTLERAKKELAKQ